MNIPSKEEVIARLKSITGADLQRVRGKQLFFSGKLAADKELLVCTPKSKLYSRGHWWIDLTSIQVSMLEKADIAILAFRVEGGSVYYVNFSHFRNYLTKEAIKNNKREGDHWKLHLWPNHINILGNKEAFYLEANNHDQIKSWM